MVVHWWWGWEQGEVREIGSCFWELGRGQDLEEDGLEAGGIHGVETFPCGSARCSEPTRGANLK